MRSTSRDGVGMANGSVKYPRKKGVYSKFDEEFQNSLQLAAGEKGRETLDPSKMQQHPTIEVFTTNDYPNPNMSVESTRDQINMS